MRSKKTGSDLELSVMQSFSKVLKQLPPESRNRVVNWVSSQDWSESYDGRSNVAGSGERAPTVQTAGPGLS